MTSPRDSVTRDTPIGVCHVTSHDMSVIKSQNVTSRHNVTDAVPLATFLAIKSENRELKEKLAEVTAEKDELAVALLKRILQDDKNGGEK
jgi:hypothetical protein